MHQVKTVSLQSGYYKLLLRNTDPKVKAIEFVDMNDVERGCRLDLAGGQLRYALHLRKPVKSASIRFLSSRLTQEDKILDLVPVSKRIFLLRKVLSAVRRHRLQNFGPGEKLLCLGGSQEVVENAAFANVEYRALRLYGLDDLSKEKNAWHWLDLGWPTATIPKNQSVPLPVRACIYLHLHYLETWPEIKSVLLDNCKGMDIIITVTKRDDDFRRETLATFPNARIFSFENRGRDVGPFMELLKQGFFENYDAVCKIHGKLSRKNGSDTISGHRIRRYTLACLLVNGLCSHVLKSFAENPNLGLLGPGNLSLPLAGKPISQYIKNELGQMKEVFKRTGTTFTPEETQFFVGTMFWFRPSAFKLLQRTKIGLADFAVENGAKKATLQHGLERAFSTLVRQAGYQIAAQQPARHNETIPTMEFI